MNRRVGLRSTKSNVSTSTTRGNTPAFSTETTTPLGRPSSATNTRGLRAIKFGHFEADINDFKNRARRDREIDRLDSACAQLEQYCPLTLFVREVPAVTNGIPSGERYRYQRPAQQMRWLKSSQAVGQAFGRNPVPFVIPCHRVIARDGTFSGYCGDTVLGMKRRLLRQEGVQL